ncbi:hypothetical protein AVEN_79731-1 [Araneus ventricosus]|uniref:Uncharacterized protein n=1 Tax=Araneus ventricosus TaxID=182803 RepID=A0A4Y2Q3Q3_ARAVE|nr:hypothetical protein AVEN_79731-1 [Araneus ventricosus]
MSTERESRDTMKIQHQAGVPSGPENRSTSTDQPGRITALPKASGDRLQFDALQLQIDSKQKQHPGWLLDAPQIEQCKQLN